MRRRALLTRSDVVTLAAVDFVLRKPLTADALRTAVRAEADRR